MTKITVRSLLGNINVASPKEIVNALCGTSDREFEVILMALEWRPELYKVMEIVAKSPDWDEKKIGRLHSRFNKLRYLYEQGLLAQGKWY